MPPAPRPKGSPGRVRIGFPVHCGYHGGHTSLGRHGRGFRIQDGRIGYGTYRLAQSIPMTEVEGVEVTERQFGGTEATTLFSMGNRPGGLQGSPPKQMTDIMVRTRDGQDALWVVQERGAEWVRGKLAAVLKDAKIPFRN